MIRKLLNSLRSKGTPRKAHPQPLRVTSDGQAHIASSCYSTVIENEEFEWDILPLIQAAERGDFPLIRYDIPPKFLSEWYWGDSSLDDHIRRALNADFSYPILVWDGQIVDGAHRCCLSLAAGVSSIKAYNIINMPPYDRSYPAKEEHRPPAGDTPLTHQAVVDALKTHMFTPPPLHNPNPLYDDPRVQEAVDKALQDAHAEHQRLLKQFLNPNKR
jgi:hypothetical protein